MKTLARLFLICLATLGQAPAAFAFAPHDAAILRQFSVCAGRLSALMEHQWLVDSPASEATENQRDALVSLVDAVMPPDQAKAAMQWRIEAKVGQSALLARATFADDAAAARRAATLVQDCLALIGQS